VAEDLGINKGTLAHWVMKDKVARGEKLDPHRADLERVRQMEREIEEFRMERAIRGPYLLDCVESRASCLHIR
jgi:hypothetical protein